MSQLTKPKDSSVDELFKACREAVGAITHGDVVKLLTQVATCGVMTAFEELGFDIADGERITTTATKAVNDVMLADRIVKTVAKMSEPSS